MTVYPFDRVLDSMKPCKPDLRKKPAHRDKMEHIMNSTNQYGFEEKIDGISGMCLSGRFFTNKRTKNKLPAEKTHTIIGLPGAIHKKCSKAIFDGEIYYPGKKSNFVTSLTNCGIAKSMDRQLSNWSELPQEVLPSYVAVKAGQPFKTGYLRYIVYDMLRDVDGTWLVELPFAARRARLEAFYTSVQNDPEFELLDLNMVHYDSFQERLDIIIRAGREGAVLKDLSATYFPGKRPMWNQIKLKQDMDDDVVITGFREATMKYTGGNLEKWPYWSGDVPVTKNYHKGLIGSIAICKFDAQGNKVDMGFVTGLTDTRRLDMTNEPGKYIGQVIKIKAMERTDDGKFRHANFLDLHPDKNAKDCLVEE